MKKTHKRIGEILVEKGLITEGQLFDALSEQKVNSTFLGSILVSRNLISSKDLVSALSDQFGIPVVELKDQYIDMELARKFPSSILLDHKSFPIRTEDNTITFAIVNPLDAIAMSVIEEQSKPSAVKFVLVDEEELKVVLQNYRHYISQSIQRLLRKDKGPIQ